MNVKKIKKMSLARSVTGKLGVRGEHGNDRKNRWRRANWNLATPRRWKAPPWQTSTGSAHPRTSSACALCWSGGARTTRRSSPAPFFRKHRAPPPPASTFWDSEGLLQEALGQMIAFGVNPTKFPATWDLLCELIDIMLRFLLSSPLASCV